MLLIVWLVLTALAVGCLIGGIKLGTSIGVFLFLIGTGLFITTGALLFAEGLQVEEQAVIQDAPDLNEGAQVIDYSYTSYTSANSLSVQVLSYVYFAMGMFFFVVMVADVLSGGK